MSMTPTIRVVEFRTEYKGTKAEDWVLYAPVHSPLNTSTWEKVSRMKPPKEIDRDVRGLKALHMNAIWAMIGPAYDAWKGGQEIPITGTPLGAWPGINQAMAEVFKRVGIRTVEEVAAITDGQVQGIHLPDVRGMRKQAAAFLDARGDAKAAQRLTDQDDQIAVMQEQLESLTALLKESEDKPKRGRPRKAEAA